MADVLKALINASEKAACIARSCCTGERNETLLVAEKCEGEANTRFDRDFKTIADVLAQESAKCEIAYHCPELAKHVKGEECSEIGGVAIQLHDTVDKTADMLRSLVCPKTAERMAEAAHGIIHLPLCDELPTDLPEINPGDLGVWIDPIDATAEFIVGVRGQADAGCGLQCVTVLIGAYLRATGAPVMGVINQPFYNKGKGRVIWGLNYNNTRKWGGSNIEEKGDKNTILMSSAENPDIVNKFNNAGWNVKSVPGAGHKLLQVVLGEAAAYIVTKGTTFFWDTCAPHSVIKAKGGDLLCYSAMQSIKYNIPKNSDIQQFCNSGGIIAYNNAKTLDKILHVLQ